MGKIRTSLNTNLKPKYDAFTYQLEAYNAVKDLDYSAVFHEQGLGKTKIAIDVTLYWLSKRFVDTVLIVTKKSLIENWKREIKNHSHFIPQILTQSRSNNYNVFNSPSRIVLAHFEVISSENERFKLYCKSRDVAIIIDESAKIKNPDASLTTSFFSLREYFKKRMILTGTPVANRPQDIWAQIFFLDGGESLGNDFLEFSKSINLSNKLHGSEKKKRFFEENLSSIYPKIRCFSVRETKQSGIIELPEKQFMNVITEWEDEQQELYTQYREDLEATIIKEGIAVFDNADNILKRLLRLVQISSNPRLVNEDYDKIPGKYYKLIEIIEEAIQKKEKVIVWSNFNDNVDFLHRNLRIYGSRKIHGKINIDKRNRSIDSFLSDDKIRILIATPGVAKEGLTLTVANNAIFYDRTFSLDDYLQSQDRIHRISQTKTCNVYNLIMENSVDEWVDALLRSKLVAAQMAQGDIEQDEFYDKMDYSFGELLRDILASGEQEE